MYAITGAAGAAGARVARRLAAADAPLRLLTRTARTLDPGTGPVPTVAAPYDDPAAVTAALDGVDTLFLVSGRESADRRGEHLGVVAAAEAAGVRRVVYLSFQGAAEHATFTFARDHWHTEQALRASSMDSTFLRDNLYLGVVPALAGADGVIRGPAGDGLFVPVSHADVADVAAAVLLDGGERFRDASLDVTGPEAISLATAAEHLSRACGREVRYVEETIEEAYASRAVLDAPEFEVTGWVSSYEAIGAGELSQVSDTVERVAGHAPVGLADYLAAHPESYAHLLP